MDDRIEVTLTGPAKVDGQRRSPGETIGVSFLVARQLEASGLIEPIDLELSLPGSPVDSDQVDALKAELALANARDEELSIENIEIRAEIEALKKPEHTEGGEKGAGEAQPAATPAAKTTRKAAAAQKG